jgi:hypothetical protein
VAALIQAVPSGRRTAGIGEVVSEIVGREHRRAETEAIQIAQDAEIAIQVEAALQIEDRGDLSGPINALDVGGRQGYLDLIAMLLDLA